MSLSPEQRAALEKAAEENGVDSAALIAAAEEDLAEREEGATSANERAVSGNAPVAVEPPKLFQYHLPFVTVAEVRRVWLGLTEPFEGDNEVAAAWAAKISAPTASTPPDEAA